MTAQAWHNDPSRTISFLLCRELGYLPIEINASDTRNKADSKITGGIGGKLANSVKELCTNTALGQDEQGRKKRASHLHTPCPRGGMCKIGAHSCYDKN